MSWCEFALRAKQTDHIQWIPAELTVARKMDLPKSGGDRTFELSLKSAETASNAQLLDLYEEA